MTTMTPDDRIRRIAGDMKLDWPDEDALRQDVADDIARLRECDDPRHQAAARLWETGFREAWMRWRAGERADGATQCQVAAEVCGHLLGEIALSACLDEEETQALVFQMMKHFTRSLGTVAGPAAVKARDLRMRGDA